MKIERDERKFDFHGIGLAIKKAREREGMTQEQLGYIVDRDPRTIMYHENDGQQQEQQHFPGFNIISVFFLTAFHSLISATASLMISAGFIRTALLWNIFSPCRVGRRRLCLTVPVSEQ